MDERFSSFVIEALVQVISGGGGFSTDPPIGVYRTGPQIDNFLGTCGIEAVGAGSRLPSLRESLKAASKQPNGNELIGRAIVKVADPRNHPREPEKTEAVVSYLNESLEADGFEVVIRNGKAELRGRGRGSMVGAFSEKSRSLNFDTVSRDIDRATVNAEADPEDAVTAACAILESVCRSILVELNLPLPAKRDVSGLVRAVQDCLDLSPARSDFPQEIAEDVRQVLGGLTTAMKGIGALRTHGGDAHGRERGRRSIDARIARLALHASSTVSLFLVETWERKFQRTLPNRSGG